MLISYFFWVAILRARMGNPYLNSTTVLFDTGIMEGSWRFTLGMKWMTNYPEYNLFEIGLEQTLKLHFVRFAACNTGISFAHA